MADCDLDYSFQYNLGKKKDRHLNNSGGVPYNDPESTVIKVSKLSCRWGWNWVRSVALFLKQVHFYLYS